MLPGDAVLTDGREEERVDNTDERRGEKTTAFCSRCSHLSFFISLKHCILKASVSILSLEIAVSVDIVPPLLTFR